MPCGYAPTKYYGPHVNEIGNYCIAAHNYDKENMFNHIIELEIGDEIFLSDNRNGKCKYKVYDIYKVKTYRHYSIITKHEWKYRHYSNYMQ